MSTPRALVRVLLPVLLLAGTARAENVQNFRPAPGSHNFLGAESSGTLGHLRYEPSVVLNLGWHPLVSRSAETDEVVEVLVEHLTSADVMAVVGLLGFLDLGIDVPVHYAAGQEVERRIAGGAALGDLTLLPKVRFRRRHSGRIRVAFAFSAPITFPTGSPERFVGEDQLTANPKLVVEAGLPGVRVALNAGARVRPEERSIDLLELGNEFTWAAAASAWLGHEDVELLGELAGGVALHEETRHSRSTTLEWLAGFRYRPGYGLVITVGGGTGLVAGYGSPVFRLLAGVAWQPPGDRDNDGLSDDDDGCPDEPEDRDGFQDADGCPDRDNDADGVDDLEDRCPDEAEDPDGYEDEDGCPEDDIDGDGIRDEDDRCPEEPEDVDEHEDEDGCPDPDNDADGILDVDDQCPLAAEVIDGIDDEDGCPEEVTDTDGDGVLDAVDRCPRVREDLDGYEDADGCPDPDNDGDTIPDKEDRCPNEPEVINGVLDDDGCPDEGAVRVTRNKIEILEKVHFEHDRDVLHSKSYQILDQVAAALKRQPDILEVQVEGHTDSRGAAAYNLRLSDRRARAVVRYLIDECGLASRRLRPRGFGKELPIASNSTAEGRDLNRRVEFRIIKWAPPEKEPGATP